MGSMKVAEARARFGEILDAAEKGLPVVIERRGVRFRLMADVPGPAGTRADAMFDFVDSGVMSGQWTWRAHAARGMQFAPRRKRR